MARPFRHADPNMFEEKKVRFLMRGVKQELLAGLICSLPNVDMEFSRKATPIEKTPKMRSRQFNHQVFTPKYEARTPRNHQGRRTRRTVDRVGLDH